MILTVVNELVTRIVTLLIGVSRNSSVVVFRIVLRCSMVYERCYSMLLSFYLIS